MTTTGFPDPAVRPSGDQPVPPASPTVAGHPGGPGVPGGAAQPGGAARPDAASRQDAAGTPDVPSALQRYLAGHEPLLVLLTVVALGALVLSFVSTVRSNAVDTGGGGGPGLAPETAAAGKAVYGGETAKCASCHGAGGGGAVGPKLNAGAVTKTFPDPLDQVRWVILGSDGGGALYATAGKTPKGGMPAFGAKLTLTEIVHVVLHERQTLAGQPLSADVAAWQGLTSLAAEFPDLNYSEAEIAALLAEIGPPPSGADAPAASASTAPR